MFCLSIALHVQIFRRVINQSSRFVVTVVTVLMASSDPQSIKHSIDLSADNGEIVTFCASQ